MNSKELSHGITTYILNNFNIINKKFYQNKYKTKEILELDDNDFVSLYSCTLSFQDLQIILTSTFIDNCYYLLISYQDLNNLPHIFFEYEQKQNKSTSRALTRAPGALYWLPMSVEQLSLNLSAFEKLRLLNQEFKVTNDVLMKDITVIFKDALKESYEGKEV